MLGVVQNMVGNISKEQPEMGQMIGSLMQGMGNGNLGMNPFAQMGNPNSNHTNKES
jgi:hypothetical protein